MSQPMPQTLADLDLYDTRVTMDLRPALLGLTTATLQTMRQGLIARSNEARNDIAQSDDAEQLQQITAELERRTGEKS